MHRVRTANDGLMELMCSTSIEVALVYRAGGSAFVHTGAEFNATDQLLYLRNRYYSPQLQRFISGDPIGLAGGDNVYAYADGSPTNLTDSLGLWAAVSVSDNSVSITLPIQYSGPGATADRVQDWNNAIQRAWSGQFGKYHVTTRVTRGPQNQITVPCGQGISHVDIPGRNTGTWWSGGLQGVNPLWIPAHEAGHLMGLDDEYWPWSGLPVDGWQHDIMGVLGQPPSERDITDIINWSHGTF